MPGVSAGDAFLDVHSRLAGDFGRRLSSQVQGPAGRAGEQASRQFGRRFAVGLKTASVAIGAGLAAATVVATRGVLATTKAASDLNETVNKTNVIFGRNAKEIQKWARGSAKSMGLSRNEALANAASFGDMFLQLKLGQPQAVRMSKSMVGLAADLASFNNADITEVLLAQQSAFRGEFDALQRFIPNINAARVQEVALAQTHKKTAKELTAAEKAQATFTIMMKDSARAQGDFARTSDGLANQQRIAQAQWENLKTTIGQGFLPAQLAVTQALNAKLLPALGVLAGDLGPKVGGVVSRLATSFANSIPSTKDLSLGLEALSAAFRGEGITTSSDKFVGKMERLGVMARRISGGIRTLIDRLRGLGPQLKTTNLEASNLPPVLNLAGAGFGLLADHSDLLAKHIGVVVGALVAYKAIQALSQAADVARVALLPGQIAGTILLARAVRTLARAQGEATGTTVANTAVQRAATLATGQATAASIRQRAAAIASTVAQKALRAATLAWAAAQRILNFVLAANPIGLVITAIALLVTGVILAYKRSETFRRIVDGAFRAVAAAGRFMWERVLKPAFLAIVSTFLMVADKIVHSAAIAFGWVPGIGPKLKAAAQKIRQFRDDANQALSGIRNREVKVTAKGGTSNVTFSVKGTRILAQARGGFVSGPGTATSDSIPALLSNGEFVINARAVREVGVATLERINAMRFAQGGLVPVARSQPAPMQRGARAWNRQLAAASNLLSERLSTQIGRALLSSGLAIGGGGGGSASVNAVAQRTAALLGRMGEWASWARRIMFESGGRWNAVNRSDINWRLGHPSVGGAQVIRGTFARWAGPFRRVGPFLYGVSINPLANSYAGANYAVHRYGSLAAVDPRVRPIGYDQGGYLRPGWNLAFNGTGQPERVLSPAEGIIDYDRMGAALARHLHGARVVLDGQQVGELVVRPMVRELHRMVKPGAARA